MSVESNWEVDDQFQKLQNYHCAIETELGQHKQPPTTYKRVAGTLAVLVAAAIVTSVLCLSGHILFQIAIEMSSWDVWQFKKLATGY